MLEFSGAGVELVTVGDQNEGAFTIQLPRGWQNQAQTVRPYGQVRSVVTALRPDGLVYFYIGDPQLPNFSIPTPDFYPGNPFANMNPLMQVHPYVPAAAFFGQNLQQRYARAPGFRLSGGGPCPALEQSARESAQRLGVQGMVTTCSFAYEYADASVSGGQVRAHLHGLTLLMNHVWVPNVCGVMVSGGEDPAAYDPLLLKIHASYQTNPQWRQMQDQQHASAMQQIQWNHQNNMQQMQWNHQNNMNWIHQSSQAHQARMDNLHATADAQMQSWQAQQNVNDGMHRQFIHGIREQSAAMPGTGGGGDFSHRRFTNYITEQETVISADGTAYQVEGGYERYYRHKNDDTYVGTDRYTERDDLRSRFGVNPDDYEEIWIKR